MTFLGKTITTEEMLPIKTKVSEFLSTLKRSKTVKQIKHFIGFFQYFCSFIPNFGEKLLPFYQLLRKENDIILTDEHHKCIATLRKDLQQACQMDLMMPKANARTICNFDRC